MESAQAKFDAGKINEGNYLNEANAAKAQYAQGEAVQGKH
jgi:hypothetical protein